MAHGDAILVGLDGSEHADRALDWAVAEARLRGRPLRLVCAYQRTSSSALTVDGLPVTADDAVRAAAERILARAAERARAEGVDVSTTVVAGGAAGALVDESERAGLLVVGARGRGGFAGLRLGSVSTPVAAHAASPVVVVHDREAAPERGAVGAADFPDDTGRVVVGVEREARDTPALELAAEEARLRGCGLILLGAAQDVAGALWAPALADSERILRAHEASLMETAERVRVRHPGLDVTWRVAQVPSAQALAGASRTAELVVVGTRGRGGFAGLMLGSTSRAVLQHGQGPIMVVPVGRARG